MLRKLVPAFVVCLLSLFAVTGCLKTEPVPNSAAGRAGQRQGTNPYRVLVVIGDQWKDPGSYTISMRTGEVEFCDVINMLKVWGIPFDILRLDQQRLQISLHVEEIRRLFADTPLLRQGSAKDKTAHHHFLFDFRILLSELEHNPQVVPDTARPTFP